MSNRPVRIPVTPPPDAAVREAVEFAENFLVPEFESIGNQHAAGILRTVLDGLRDAQGELAGIGVVQYRRAEGALREAQGANATLRALVEKLEKVRESAAWMREVQRQRNGSFNNWQASDGLQEQRNNAVRALDAALAGCEEVGRG